MAARWDSLSPDKQKVLASAAKISRDFERKDNREETAKALDELRAKGMKINELSPTETTRMHDKLTRINASIAANVGIDLWTQTQVKLAQVRSGK